MAASSSSLAGLPVFAVDLYNQNFQKQGTVDVPVTRSVGGETGPPALVQFQGQSYVWDHRQNAYTAVQPYSPQADLGAPRLSVLADPGF